MRFFKTLAAMCIAALCLSQTAWASTAEEIASYIAATTYGDLAATVSGDTVTVTGEILSASANSNFLTFNIDADVTVVWQATLKGAPSSSYSLINISGGSGTFTVQSGSIENTSTGRAFTNASTSTVNISGGIVSSTSGDAIYNYSTGSKVDISGGTVSATSGRAIYNSSSKVITVSGNATKITSANTNSTEGTIHLHYDYKSPVERLVITGGTVENTATGNAIYSAVAINISGGTVAAVLGRAIVVPKMGSSSNAYANDITISGGTISSTSGSAIYSHGNVTILGGELSAGGLSAIVSNRDSYIHSEVKVNFYN